ncbi:MAG: septum formation inhibitor Maf [Solobacterium sp.]|nr:septum formation inhibitor Maf [Solobacterium sp.]
MKQLILASASPRRQELLEKCGYPFLVDVANIDESINPSLGLSREIMRISKEKAKVVLARHQDAVVIGSDTIVTLENEVLGKPQDEKDAVRMLKMLSGQTHQVITGLCILSSKKEFVGVSVSDVTFEILSEEEINRYVETKEPLDKAGAYAIQGIASRYIKEIHGDYYAIMGLPVSLVYEELKNLSEY